MKFMMLIYYKEGVISEPEREECYVESIQLTHDLNAKGQYLAAAPLHSVTTASSVKVRDGKRIVTDGPFAETREQLGGYYLVDVPTMEDAVEIAAKIPASKFGTIEVRPVIELQNMPEVN